MKTWAFREHGGDLECIEVATPEPRGEEVLLRITSCGVCHSDVHIWEGFFDLGGGRRVDLSRGRTRPFTPGHEIVAQVIGLGPDASGVGIGDRRVVYPWIGCGECSWCRGGDEHLCSAPRALGIDVTGGFADAALVPSSRYLHDFGEVDPSLAGTYACSGLTAFGAIERIRPLVQGRSLLLLGAGGLGMAGLAIAKATLDTEVGVLDVNEPSLEAARAAGADWTVNGRDADAAKQILRRTGGGVAGAVDFVGAESSTRTGVAALAKGGRLVVVGLFGGALSLSLPLLPLKVIGLEGSYVGSPDQMKALMDLARRGRLPATPIHERPIGEAQQALEDLRDGHGIGRTVLRVSEFQ